MNFKKGVIGTCLIVGSFIVGHDYAYYRDISKNNDEMKSLARAETFGSSAADTYISNKIDSLYTENHKIENKTWLFKYFI